MRFGFRTFNSNDFLDRAGATASWLCAVHCLATPSVVSFLPLLGISFLANEGVEYFFIGFSIIVAALSLLPAYLNRHGKIRAILLFASGLNFVIFADILFEDDLIGKIIFLFIGATCITAAHLLNRRLCRSCLKCAEDSNRSST
jgi:hypothetical protein